MIKTYVTFSELQYLFDNQLVFTCLLIFFYCSLTLKKLLLYLKQIYISYNLFINIIYDDYLIIYYTCKLNFSGKIITYYNHNQI